MATTGNFGQIKDLRLKGICVKNKVTVDSERNICSRDTLARSVCTQNLKPLSGGTIDIIPDICFDKLTANITECDVYSPNICLRNIISKDTNVITTNDMEVVSGNVIVKGDLVFNNSIVTSTLTTSNIDTPFLCFDIIKANAGGVVCINEPFIVKDPYKIIPYQNSSCNTYFGYGVGNTIENKEGTIFAQSTSFSVGTNTSAYGVEWVASLPDQFRFTTIFAGGSQATGATDFRILFYYTDTSNFYQFYWISGTMVFEKVSSSGYIQFGMDTAVVKPVHIDIRVNDVKIDIYIDGVLTYTANDSEFRSGSMRFGRYDGANSAAFFRLAILSTTPTVASAGTDSTFFGYLCGGSGNSRKTVSIGCKSLYGSQGDYSVSIGHLANSGAKNAEFSVAIGNKACQKVNFSQDIDSAVAIGSHASEYGSFFNQECSVVIGYKCGARSYIGYGSSMIGYKCGYDNIEGESATFSVGNRSSSYSHNIGFENFFLGNDTGKFGYGYGNRAVYVGGRGVNNTFLGHQECQHSYGYQFVTVGLYNVYACGYNINDRTTCVGFSNLHHGDNINFSAVVGINNLTKPISLPHPNDPTTLHQNYNMKFLTLLGFNNQIYGQSDSTNTLFNQFGIINNTMIGSSNSIYAVPGFSDRSSNNTMIGANNFHDRESFENTSIGWNNRILRNLLSGPYEYSQHNVIVGKDNTVDGVAETTVIGRDNVLKGNTQSYSTVIGSNNTVNNASGIIAVGHNINVGNVNNSIVVGCGSYTTGNNCVIIGSYSHSNYDNCIVLGRGGFSDKENDFVLNNVSTSQTANVVSGTIPTPLGAVSYVEVKVNGVRYKMPLFKDSCFDVGISAISDGVSNIVDGNVVVVQQQSNDDFQVERDFQDKYLGNPALNGGFLIQYDAPIDSACAQIGDDLDGNIAGDQFGYSVAINADGYTVAAGSIYHGSSSGHVKVYDWDNNTQSFIQRGLELGGSAINDESGYSISLSDDGNTIAIGAPQNSVAGLNTGAISVYEWSGSAWVQKGANINGILGVYTSLGYSVSLSADGNTVAGGAPSGFAGLTGSAVVYEWSGSAWVAKGNVINGASVGDYFGQSVSISGDGNRIIVGATDFGGSNGYISVYEYNSGSNMWLQLGTSITENGFANFGQSFTSISTDGNVIAFGAPYANGTAGTNTGHVRVFDWNSGGGTWDQRGSDIEGDLMSENIGLSCSLSGDGNRLMIGQIYSTFTPTTTKVYQWEEVVPLGPTGVNFALESNGSTASATSTYSSQFLPREAINGILENGSTQDNYWLSADGITSAELTVDFGQLRTINEIKLVNCRNGPYFDRSARDYRLGVSVDGVNFTQVGSGTLTEDDITTRVSNVFTQVTVRYIRFYMDNIYGVGGGLSEIEAFLTPTFLTGWKKMCEDIPGETTIDWNSFIVAFSRDGQRGIIGAPLHPPPDEIGAARVYNFRGYAPGLCIENFDNITTQVGFNDYDVNYSLWIPFNKNINSSNVCPDGWVIKNTPIEFWKDAGNVQLTVNTNTFDITWDAITLAEKYAISVVVDGELDGVNIKHCYGDIINAPQTSIILETSSVGYDWSFWESINSITTRVVGFVTCDENTSCSQHCIPNPPPNSAPIVDAGMDSGTVTGTVTLAGTVTDDGNPFGILTSKWTQLSGPATATIADDSLPVTTATLPSLGTYVFKLSASDAALQSSDTVTHQLGTLMQGSYYFNGSSNLQVSGTNLYNTSSWTIEWWQRLESPSGAQPFSNGGSHYLMFRNYLSFPFGNFYYLFNNYATTNNVTGIYGYPYIANTWIHVAVVCNGYNHAIYLDGYNRGGFYRAAIYNGGTFTIAAAGFTGRITSFRVTRQALYSGGSWTSRGFTPPSYPLPALGNTTLLLNGQNPFMAEDTSSNNRTVTNNGGVTWSSLHP